MIESAIRWDKIKTHLGKDIMGEKDFFDPSLSDDYMYPKSERRKTFFLCRNIQGERYWGRNKSSRSHILSNSRFNSPDDNCSPSVCSRERCGDAFVV